MTEGVCECVCVCVCVCVCTHGAVRSHPVGVTAAQPGVGDEGPVAVALVWALGPGQLAVEAPPARLAVALPVHTDAVVGTCRIQAIHCIKKKRRVIHTHMGD